MKAKKLLQRYEAGERDFQGINLQGESLKGQNLSDANFSGADIRGANFSQAKLKGSNFKLVKAGLPTYWLYIFGITAYLITGLNGLVTEGISTFMLTHTSELHVVAYTIILPNLVIHWILNTQEGFKVFLLSFIPSLSILVNIFVFTYIFLPILNQEINHISIIILLSSTIFSACLALGFTNLKALHIYYLKIILVTASLTLPISMMYIAELSNNPGRLLFPYFLGFISIFNSFWISFFISTAITLIIFCMGIPFFFSYILQDDIGVATAILSSCIGIAVAFTALDNASLFSLLLPLTVITLSIYMTRGFLSIQYKDSPLDSLAVAIACMGGTSFRKADLTDASFSQADLGCTDFRQAKLTPTVLTQTKNLDRVRSSDSYYQICQNYFRLFIQILTDQKAP